MNTDKTFRIRHLNRPESFAQLITALSAQGITVAASPPFIPARRMPTAT
jgi:hypothetical protein